MDKDKQIKMEIAKLNKIFMDIPDDRKKMVEHLIQNAAFMAITLQDLQADIIEHGAVISCQSGNGFETLKDNPAQKAYTTMISRYIAVIDQLKKFLPSDTARDANDELLEFLGTR